MSMLGNEANRTESIDVIRARIAIYLTLAGLSLVLNGTFLVVLWKSWNLVKQKRITYHVANLAISDSLVGASTFLHFILEITMSTETQLSNVLVLITWTATLTSLLAVCLMAVERAVAIKKPHTWLQILPLKKIFLLMIGNWLLILPLAVLMYFYPLTMKFVLLLLFFVPICVTLAVYFYIYLGVWKMGRQNSQVRSSPSNTKDEKNKAFQRKVGSFVLLLTAILLITVSPSFVCVEIRTACELFELRWSSVENVINVSNYLYMLEICNFVVNPFFYVWRIRMYRKALWQLFTKKNIAIVD